jgi:hypothetical protein
LENNIEKIVRDVGCEALGLDYLGPREKLIWASCEQGNVTSDSIKSGALLDCLRDY